MTMKTMTQQPAAETNSQAMPSAWNGRTCTVCERTFYSCDLRAPAPVAVDGAPFVCERCEEKRAAIEEQELRTALGMSDFAPKISTRRFDCIPLRELKACHEEEASALPFDRWVMLEVLGAGFDEWVKDEYGQAQDAHDIATFKLSQRTNDALSDAIVLRGMSGLEGAALTGRIANASGETEGEDFPGLVAALDDAPEVGGTLLDFLALQLSAARAVQTMELFRPMYWWNRSCETALDGTAPDYFEQLFEMYLHNSERALRDWDAFGLTFEELGAWWQECLTEPSEDEGE